MLKLFFLQIIILLLTLIFLALLKRWWFAGTHLKIKVIDVVPFFILWYLHNLTITRSGFSIVPYVVMVWILLGAVVLVFEVYISHRFRYGRFYVNFWRIGDLYLLLVWMITGFCCS